MLSLMANIISRMISGGTLYEHIGKKEALDLMRYVDDINVAYGGQDTKNVFYCRNQIQKALYAE